MTDVGDLDDNEYDRNDSTKKKKDVVDSLISGAINGVGGMGLNGIYHGTRMVVDRFTKNEEELKPVKEELVERGVDVACASGGAIIGSFIIPFPIVGTLIGGMAGSFAPKIWKYVRDDGDSQN